MTIGAEKIQLCIFFLNYVNTIGNNSVFVKLPTNAFLAPWTLIRKSIHAIVKVDIDNFISIPTNSI